MIYRHSRSVHPTTGITGCRNAKRRGNLTASEAKLLGALIDAHVVRHSS